MLQQQLVLIQQFHLLLQNTGNVNSGDSKNENVISENNNSTTKVDSKKTIEVIENSPFAGGDGSEAFPFLIVNNSQLKALEEYTKDSNKTINAKLLENIYITPVIADKTVSTLIPYISISSSVNLDMNDKTIGVKEGQSFGKATPVIFAVLSASLMF